MDASRVTWGTESSTAPARERFTLSAMAEKTGAKTGAGT